MLVITDGYTGVNYGRTLNGHTRIRNRESFDQRRDVTPVCLQRKVAGVQQVNFRIRQIAFEGFCARGDEDLVVFCPKQATSAAYIGGRFPAY